MAGGTGAAHRRRPSAVSGGPSGAGRDGAPPPRLGGVLRALRLAAGFLLLTLGVIGLLLPILQGVLLILAGLAVLGRDLPWSRALTERLARFVRRRASRGERPSEPSARSKTP